MTEAFKQGYNDYLMKVAGIVEPGGPAAWIESAKPVTEAVPEQPRLSPIDQRAFSGLKNKLWSSPPKIEHLSRMYNAPGTAHVVGLATGNSTGRSMRIHPPVAPIADAAIRQIRESLGGLQPFGVTEKGTLMPLIPPTEHFRTR